MIPRSLNKCLLVLAMLFAASSLAAAPQDAETLMTQHFYVGKVSGFQADVKMVLRNDKDEERVRDLSVWSKLQDNEVDSQVLIRFKSPRDIQNTGFLQIENSAADDSIWIYLPALGKSRRLVANNKRDSFFGSDFSYGDILLPAVKLYRHQLLRSEPCGESKCQVVESIPANEQVRNDSGYSKKITWLDERNSTEVKVEYYDLEGALLKTQIAQKYQLIEPEKQRWVPLYREMINHQTGHKTIYQFVNIKLDRDIPDSLFTVRQLER